MLRSVLSVIGGIVIAVVVLGVLIQFIPYGHDHTDPATVAEPKWDSPQTRALVVRACFDCHSDQTTWPWYSNVAPLSWLIQRDVSVGRARLNFSEWNQPGREAGGAARTVQRGTMPQWYYVLLHPSANLSPTEKQALIQGLEATLGSGGGEGFENR